MRASATHTARDVYLLRLTRHNVDLASSSPLLSRPVKVRHKGTSLLPMWQALRATTAAPSYFAEVLLQSSSILGGIEREAGVESDEADDGDDGDGGDLPPKLVLQARAAPSPFLGLSHCTAGCCRLTCPRATAVVPQDGALLANNPAAIALQVVVRAPLAPPHAFRLGARPLRR